MPSLRVKDKAAQLQINIQLGVDELFVFVRRRDKPDVGVYLVEAQQALDFFQRDGCIQSMVNLANKAVVSASID